MDCKDYSLFTIIHHYAPGIVGSTMGSHMKFISPIFPGQVLHCGQRLVGQEHHRRGGDPSPGFEHGQRTKVVPPQLPSGKLTVGP